MNNLKKYQFIFEQNETDALLLTSHENRQYAAGFNVDEGIALICPKHAYYFTDSRYIETAQKNLPDFCVQLVDVEHSYSALLKEAIKQEKVHVLGFEDDDLTYSLFERFRASLNVVLKPCSSVIDEPRMAKEPWELDYMRQAQAITDATFTQMLEIIRPGISEKDLCAELLYRLSKNGSHAPAFDAIVISGPNTSMPHGVPGERIVQKGDFITMDFGASVCGYCSDMTRTVAVDSVSDEMRKVYDIVLQAQLAALQITKAGITGREMDAAARNIIREHGYGAYFGHAYGHGLGLKIHEMPNAGVRSEVRMMAGAVVSAEPGIYLPGRFGVRIEDTTVITASGCEILTKSPKNLIIL